MVVMVTNFHVPRSSMVAEAKLVMSVVFNGGSLPTVEGYSCNDHDTQLIKSTIGADDDDGDNDGDDDDVDIRDEEEHCDTKGGCKHPSTFTIASILTSLETI